MSVVGEMNSEMQMITMVTETNKQRYRAVHVKGYESFSLGFVLLNDIWFQSVYSVSCMAILLSLLENSHEIRP